MGHGSESVQAGPGNPAAQVLVFGPSMLVGHVHRHHAEPVYGLTGHGNHAADVVLFGFVIVAGLNMGDERGTEGGLKRSYHLHRNPVAVKHRHLRPAFHRGGRAVDIQAIRVRGDRAFFQNDLILFNAFHATQAHDVSDGLERGHFSLGHDGSVVHGGLHVIVQPQQHLAGTQPVKQIWHRLCLRRRFQLCRKSPIGLGKKIFPRLDQCAIHVPGVTRHDPGDGLWRGTVFQQPQACINARFAGANDHVTGTGPLHLRQLVDRYACEAAGHAVFGRVGRRHRCIEVSGVDNLLVHVHVPYRT